MFTCNICGAENTEYIKHRELYFCKRCGSNARFRAIIDGVKAKLWPGGDELPLDQLPYVQKKVLDFSGSEIYGNYLSRKCEYLNTFYHAPPFLDICGDVEDRGQFDVVICSDVFEHILPPLDKPFSNLRKLTKSDGVLVFSVPTLEGDETYEHFPEINDFKIVEIKGRYFLLNANKNGDVKIHQNLVFHGGPGQVLEMRMFSHTDVERRLKAAGFSNVSLVSNVSPAKGLNWDIGIERPEFSPKNLLGYIFVANT
jgi:SAM-dependent methyltransferase